MYASVLCELKTDDVTFIPRKSSIFFIQPGFQKIYCEICNLAHLVSKYYFPFRDCNKKMKEGIGWNLKISGFNWDIYLMFLSRENKWNCVNIIPKRIHIGFWIRFVVLNRSDSTNTLQIWKLGYPRRHWETQVYSYYYLNLKGVFAKNERGYKA